MKNTDDIFESLGGIFFKNLIDSTNEKNEAASLRLMLAGLGILTFVGAEAVKLVFRSNFGSKGVSIFRAVLCFLAFGLIATPCFYAGLDEANPDLEKIGSPLSFWAMGVFYGVLGIYVLIKSIVAKVRAKDAVHPQYRGDSKLLASLMKSGWSQSRVQNFAEPMLTLAVGVFLTAFNFLWGLPLFFCAISVWLHQLLELIYGVSHVRDMLAEHGYNLSQSNSFTEVKS